MVSTARLTHQTRGNNDIVDITKQVYDEVAKSGLRSGIVCITVVGSTASITTMEYEPGLQADLKEFLNELAPPNRPYKHNATWNDDNGHSHLRASLMGPSLTLPLVGGALALGTWQQVVLIDFDHRPRQREVVVQVVGE